MHFVIYVESGTNSTHAFELCQPATKKKGICHAKQSFSFRPVREVLARASPRCVVRICDHIHYP
jgi:hypothetical protein